MHPKSPHVSGRTARCPRSESRAPLAARPAEHASVPHSNASMKPARVEAKKPTLDTRPFMTGPALNATPAELLPSVVYLISYLNEAKRGQESHTSAAPLSPPPFCPLLQWLTKSSYSASKPARGSATRRSRPARRGAAHGRRCCRPRRRLLPRLPFLWPRLPCRWPRHASSDRSQVRGERRVGGQRLRVRRHHRGEVEHGRPPPLGSHEGHRRGDAGVHSRCLAGSFCCKDLRRPRMGSTEEGNVRMNSSRCRPWRSNGR